jgi:hypothetical protein
MREGNPSVYTINDEVIEGVPFYTELNRKIKNYQVIKAVERANLEVWVDINW